MPRPPKKRRALPETMGKHRQFLSDNFGVFPDNLDSLKNGHLLLLFIHQDSSITKTITAAKEKQLLSSITLSQSQMSILINRSKKFQSTKETIMTKYYNFCCETFRPYAEVQQPLVNPVPRETQLKPSSSVSKPLQTDPGPLVTSDQKTPMKLAVPPETPGSSSILPVASTSIRSTSRKGPHTPRTLSIRLKKRLDFATESGSAIKTRHKERIKELKLQLKNQAVQIRNVKYLNQEIKRKKLAILNRDNKIVRLRKEFSNSSVAKKLAKSKQDIKCLKHKNKRIKNRAKLKQSSGDCALLNAFEMVKSKEELAAKDEIISHLENEKLCLEENVELMKDHHPKIFEQEGRMFPLEIRMFVYDCIINHVPTNNVPILMTKAAQRFGFQLDNVPHRTSVEMMVRELGVMTDYQVAEYLLENDNLTLGFDATTQEGVHINEVHITSPQHCLVVDMDQLAGGTTEDYEMHIVNSINRVADVYALFQKCDFEDTRRQIVGHIKNTMTDRVAVNHSTISRLEQTWGVGLNELNCHLHPLDTIASSSRSTLKNVETAKGKLFGTDCVAGNIVLAVNKVRYKDGKGDPKGFVAFLEKEGLPKGLIPRYRGNRLHVLFHICGKLVCYHENFVRFFSSTTVSCGGLLAAILVDFTSTEGKIEIQVLGLIGKLLTGPWMTKFYSAGESQSVSHVDGIQVVKRVVDKIKSFIQTPMDTLEMKTDFFDQKLVDDIILQKLQIKPTDELMFANMMSQCLSKIVVVLERQYDRYFKLDITEQLRKETESSRCHNIDAEEVMGMFSAAKDHAPNATLCFLSCKIRAQKNKTGEYLDGLDQQKREKLVKFSMPLGRKQRQVKRQKCGKIKEEIQLRIAAKMQKKQTYEKNKLEKQLKNASLDIAAEFSDLSEVCQEGVRDILAGKVVGRRICHVWYESGGKMMYNGKIEKLKKKGGGTCYWNENEGETYEDGVDFDILKFALAADYICEDLTMS